jgi:hypothetical protein
MVTVFEAPDDEALRAHLLEIGSLGNCEPPRSERTTRKKCRGYSGGSADPFNFRELCRGEVRAGRG